MTAIDHLKGLWGISGGFWLLFGLYVIFSIKKFIVRRYEEETDLGQTIFFTKHMPFAKYAPDFFSSSFYAGHLLSFVWGWKFIKFIKEKRPNVTYFDDIDSPDVVIRNFSAKEIRRIKLVAIIIMILFLHGIAFCIFHFIWPDVFS
jgi:hypothetical protein